ncbi:Zinc finger protein [Plecturocebus cupreus]
MCHHAQLIFVLLVETRFHWVGQAGRNLLTSGDPPTWASQSSKTESHFVTRLEYSGRTLLEAAGAASARWGGVYWAGRPRLDPRL